jgi:hypothetical protein
MGGRTLRRRGRLCLFAGVALLLTEIDPAQAQLVVSDSSVGYLDNAIPGNQLRLRFDAAYGADFPDRAEFLYGTWARAVPGAPGPPLRECNLDYQDLVAYLELSPVQGFSSFVEAPLRFLNPEINANTAGYGDLSAGVKWAFLQDALTTASFQLRAYVPTGDSARGLGTDHVSLEPGLLLLHRLSERLSFEGELRDWIPVDGTEGFAGNVLRYGAGVSYLVHDTCAYRVRPVAELVGWTVLDGKKTNLAGIAEADGDTIVNLQIGVRIGLWPECGERQSLYVGYGRALTGEVWYEDIIRAELRFLF